VIENIKNSFASLQQDILFQISPENKKGICVYRFRAFRSDFPECVTLQGRIEEDSSAIFPKDEIDRSVAQPANSIKEDDVFFGHGMKPQLSPWD
jgi:hypothetical protein